MNLKVGSATHGRQTALMIDKIDKYLKINKKINNVIVYGDTNSALAGAIASSKYKNIILTHVEAGLRSFDKNMPEEISRRLIDHCSDLLFCPTKYSKKYLLNEGIKSKKIFIVGNTIVDAIKSPLINNQLKNSKSPYNYKYLLLTIHREENTINQVNIKKIFKALYKINKKFGIKVIFPVHPKTRKIINFLKYDKKKINIVHPVDYLTFLKLLKHATLVISDSGGVQEEACILKTPLITVRNSTERPETLEIGCNILTNLKKNLIFQNSSKILKKKIHRRNPYGNGKAAVKIVKIIKKAKLKNVKSY